MNCADLHVGDQVVVRMWHDMESEFGLDRLGRIKTNPRFVRGMESLSGIEGRVNEILPDGRIKISGLEDCSWMISADMLEHVCEIDCPSDIDFISILFPGKGGEIP